MVGMIINIVIYLILITLLILLTITIIKDLKESLKVINHLWKESSEKNKTQKIMIWSTGFFIVLSALVLIFGVCYEVFKLIIK